MEIAATAVGLVVTIGTLTAQATQFVRAYKYAKSDIELVVTELESLRIALNTLKSSNLCSRTKAGADAPDQSADVLHAIEKLLQDCETILGKISDTLQKYSDPRFMGQISWIMFGRPDINAYRSSLECNKCALNIALDARTILLVTKQGEVMDNVDINTQEIREVVLKMNNAIEKMISNQAQVDSASEDRRVPNELMHRSLTIAKTVLGPVRRRNGDTEQLASEEDSLQLQDLKLFLRNNAVHFDLDDQPKERVESRLPNTQIVPPSSGQVSQPRVSSTSESSPKDQRDPNSNDTTNFDGSRAEKSKLAELHELQRKYNEREWYVEELQLSVASIRDSKTTVQQENEILQAKLQSLENDKNALQESFKKLNSDFRNLNDMHRKVNLERTCLQRRVDQLVFDQQRSASTQASLQRSNSNLSSEQSALKTAIARLQARFNLVHNPLESEISRATQLERDLEQSTLITIETTETYIYHDDLTEDRTNVSLPTPRDILPTTGNAVRRAGLRLMMVSILPQRDTWLQTFRLIPHSYYPTNLMVGQTDQGVCLTQELINNDLHHMFRNPTTISLPGTLPTFHDVKMLIISRASRTSLSQIFTRNRIFLKSEIEYGELNDELRLENVHENVLRNIWVLLDTDEVPGRNLRQPERYLPVSRALPYRRLSPDPTQRTRWPTQRR